MDLTKLHRNHAEDLLERRIKHLARPFLACRVLARLDYRLLASLAALEPTHQMALDTLASEKAGGLFFQVFYGLHHQQNATLEAIDSCIDDLDRKQHSSLIQAIKLAAIRLAPESHWIPQSPILRLLLLQHASSISETMVINWLQQADGELAATCIQRLGQTLNHEHQMLIHQRVDSTCPLTRLAALQTLSLHACQQSRQQLLQEPPESLQRFVPALLIASWLHSDALFGQSPLCTAFTGKPEAIPVLIEQMQQAETLTEAYAAWLWLTGRTLPHYPSLQAVDAKKRHVAPGQDTMPDIAFAERWWRKQSLQHQKRYFLGQPLDAAGLQRLAQNLTGRCLPLLAIHQQLCGLTPTYRMAGFYLAEGIKEFSHE